MADPVAPREEEEKRRWSRGVSWLIAGSVLFFAGFASLGGGYAFTAMSAPLFLTALIFGARSIRVAAAILLVLALFATTSLYTQEREYWPPARPDARGESAAPQNE